MVNSVLAGGAVAHRVVDRGFQHFVVDRGFQHFILPALDIGPGVDNDAGQALALSRAAHKGLGRVDPEAFLSGNASYELDHPGDLVATEVFWR